MLVDMGFAKGSTGVVIGGATIAGFFAAACSLPFDFVKTQMQKMKPDPVTGAVPYSVSEGWGARGAGGVCRSWEVGRLQVVGSCSEEDSFPTLPGARIEHTHMHAAHTCAHLTFAPDPRPFSRPRRAPWTAR